MNLVAFLWFNLALVCISNVSSEPLSEHDVVGIDSDKKITALMKKALAGFRNLLRTGDDKLALPILDPFEIEVPSWHYEDDDSGTRLDIACSGSGLLKGLSNFQVDNIEFDFKAFIFHSSFSLKNVKFQVPCTIEGVLKHIFPVYGGGIVKLDIENYYVWNKLDFSLKESRIVEGHTYNYFDPLNLKFEEVDLMDLPSRFTAAVLRDVSGKFADHYRTSVWGNNFIQDLIDKHLVGKTMDEVLEFLNYLASKAD